MKSSHQAAILRYNSPREQARALAAEALPPHLYGKLTLGPVDYQALTVFRALQTSQGAAEFDWQLSPSYCNRYPKAFDLAVWYSKALCSFSLGRPTFNGTEMRLDFVEKFTKEVLFAGEMFGVSLLAYEAYGKLIGANKLRIMDPQNKKLIEYYSSHGGFSYQQAAKGNPHYLVKVI